VEGCPPPPPPEPPFLPVSEPFAGAENPAAPPPPPADVIVENIELLPSLPAALIG